MDGQDRIKVGYPTWKVSAAHRIEYDVEMTSGVLELDNALLASKCGRRVLVVVDHTIEELFGEKIREYFDHYRISASVVALPPGESAKVLSSVLMVTDAIEDVGLLRRSEAVVVIGGGVVMDIVGLAANLFRRGIPYVRVPTTLIGLVDAGVGVKTGVNSGGHKNRLGTYFAPEATLCDPGFLSTLPARHIRNGLAEIAKIALVKDRALFNLLETAARELSRPGGSFTTIESHPDILRRAIGGMLEELEENLHEADLERIVDFGHTFSPSIELVSVPALLHGEAVSVDMALCIALSRQRGLLTDADADRALNLLVGLGLPITNDSFRSDLLLLALGDAIKHRDGLQRVPLLSGLGKATFVNDLTAEELDHAMDATRRFGPTEVVAPVLIHG